MSQDARSPIEILRAIQKGTLSSKCLSGESRRACMVHLLGEAQTQAEIAEFFKVSLRTVQRDLETIHEENAVSASPEVQKQLIGQMVLQARQSITRLTKIARDRTAPHTAQAQAAYDSWRVMRELVEMLQKLGIMPLVPQQVQTDIHHVVQTVPSVQEMLGEVAIIEQACGAADAPKELVDGLSTIKGLLAQARAADAIKELKGKEKEAGQ